MSNGLKTIEVYFLSPDVQYLFLTHLWAEILGLFFMLWFLHLQLTASKVKGFIGIKLEGEKENLRLARGVFSWAKPIPFHWPELRHIATPNFWGGI